MLELRQITQNYDDHPLLCGVDLTVAAGEVVALLGPSGSGKSTLLSIVAGLQLPRSGEVWFDGQNITRVPPHQRRFALMFQDFALFPHLNVQDNVGFGLIEQGLSRARSRAQALEMLEVFGLTRQAKQQVWQLSGGEQQRVALARALITRPRALLLDEPFSALDADLRVAMREEFSQHIAQAAIPTLLVTHDASEASAMASRAVKLVEGRLAEMP